MLCCFTVEKLRRSRSVLVTLCLTLRLAIPYNPQKAHFNQKTIENIS